MVSVKELAQEVCDNMCYDEERDLWHQKKCGDPAWIQDMIHKCHYNGMLPDDFVFETVHGLCYEIANSDYDPRDIDLQPLDYYSDMLAWVSSNLSRMDFVDEALEEMWGSTKPAQFYEVMQLAQVKEKDFILNGIMEVLEERSVNDTAETQTI